MLWAVEEQPSDFWKCDAANETVVNLLASMMGLLKAKFIPNYFIPNVNILDATVTSKDCIELQLYRDYKRILRFLSLHGNSTTISYLVTSSSLEEKCIERFAISQICAAQK